MKYQSIIEQHNPSQSHWELNQLLLTLEPLHPKRILEIGTHRGGSIRVWRDVFNPELLVGINDTSEMTDSEGIQMIIGRSQEEVVRTQVIDESGNKPIDFLFIDGSHYYNDVKEDFRMYSQLVRPGGIIAFHDVIITDNYACEVHKLWEEIQRSHKTLTIWDGTPSGSGEGVVFL